jgi:NifU-like protein involved in Fe-S cluster formation
MQIYLQVGDGGILDTKFLTDDCGTTLASVSMLTELIKGGNIGGDLENHSY